MSGLTNVTKPETTNKKSSRPGTQGTKPRTLDDVLRKGKGKPSPFQKWSLMVEGQVDAELLKRKLDKGQLSEKQLAAVRNDVLANDRSYWL